ncbi:MAG: 30S ribosomal protein S8 [Patescibacteria group bacterium]
MCERLGCVVFVLGKVLKRRIFRVLENLLGNSMDTVGNTLTILLNGQRVGKKRVAVPFSRFTERLLNFMKEQKLIGDIRLQETPKAKLIVSLAYSQEGKGAISGSQRISKPGRRVYAGADFLPYSRQESGMIIVSTPEGLMSEKKARGKGVGGELICAIW